MANTSLQQKIKQLLSQDVKKRTIKRISKYSPGKIFLKNDTVCIEHGFNSHLNKKYHFLGGFKFNSTTKCWELIKKNDVEIARFLLNIHEYEPNYYWTIDPESARYLKKVIENFDKSLEHYRDIMKIKKMTDTDIDVSHLKVKPFGFQKVGMLFLERNNGVAFIGDDMGLGKSMQFIAYTSKYKYKTLVVCPAALKYNLHREIENFTYLKPVVITEYKKMEDIPKDADYYICNYEQLKKYLKFLEKQKFDCIVIDESHNIKNSSSDRYKIVKKFSKIPRRILLSGTAIKNAPIEFYTQLKFLKPDMFPRKEQYGLRYCDAKENYYAVKEDGEEKSTKARFSYDYSGSSNLRELHNKISGFYIRRLKTTTLTDLPPKLIHMLDLELNAKQETEYKKLVKDLKQSYSSKGNTLGFLAQTVKLKQYLSHTKINSTVEFIENILEQDPTKKVIVFSQFQYTQESLLTIFGDKACSIFGSYDAKKRMNEVDEFSNNPTKRVLVSSTLAGGVGFNITCADTVVFCDLMWAPADHSQAEDRAFRIGQKKLVNVYYLVYRNTIDSLLWKILDFKIDLLGQVLDGKEAQESVSERLVIRKFIDAFMQEDLPKKTKKDNILSQ